MSSTLAQSLMDIRLFSPMYSPLTSLILRVFTETRVWEREDDTQNSDGPGAQSRRYVEAPRSGRAGQGSRGTQAHSFGARGGATHGGSGVGHGLEFFSRCV